MGARPFKGRGITAGEHPERRSSLCRESPYGRPCRRTALLLPLCMGRKPRALDSAVDTGECVNGSRTGTSARCTWARPHTFTRASAPGGVRTFAAAPRARLRGIPLPAPAARREPSPNGTGEFPVVSGSGACPPWRVGGRRTPRGHRGRLLCSFLGATRKERPPPCSPTGTGVPALGSAGKLNRRHSGKRNPLGIRVLGQFRSCWTVINGVSPRGALLIGGNCQF